MSTSNDKQLLEQKITRLETQLHNTRTQLREVDSITTTSQSESTGIAEENRSAHAESEDQRNFSSVQLPSHPLLHLTDSALPLGSFAFSSGLESFLAHHSPAQKARPNTLHQFLHTSLNSLASATLPYLIALFKAPQRLEELDDVLDACTLCPVAKRASVSQGRALITIWERSLRAESPSSVAKETLQRFSSSLRESPDVVLDGELAPNAHFPLIYAAVCAAQGLSLHETAYSYMFNHAKAVVSAAVRASVLGPYAAQGILASRWLRGQLEEGLQREWEREVDEAGQTVPTLDVWIGRHELLYSRIFNS